MPPGFRDPLGNGKITAKSSDGDGYYAYRNFLTPDTDDGDRTGMRHLGTDWNAKYDSDELAYAAYKGKVAYASANAGGDRGGVVMLNHELPDGRKITTVYMHLEHIPPEILNGTKKTVERGDFLGDSGFVKAGWGLHVHYEVREGHQTGLSGVGYGYHGAPGQGVLVGSGFTSDGIQYADIRNADGNKVRYLDPIAFTEKYRTLTEVVAVMPDLIIQNLSIDDVTVTIGQEVRVQWEVKNIGSVGAIGSVAGVYLSRDQTWNKATDIRVDFNSTSSLAKGAVDTGESATFSIPSSASAGTWYVLVVADEKDALKESSESNNVLAQKITIGGIAAKPDFVIQNAEMDDTSVRPGQRVRVEWDVANIGDKALQGSETSVFLSRDKTLSASDILLDEETFGTLKAGDRDSEFSSFRIPEGLAKGRYYMALVADVDMLVLESNDANNITWLSFDVI